ncbi:MAG TPA: AIR synthase-related protein, partial [Myxococcota bacterium]|nr:AIR synthase-related protein [Myxococcota bacterium]
QTCGGLLLAVDPGDASAVVGALRDAGEGDACVVGRLVPGSGVRVLA